MEEGRRTYRQRRNGAGSGMNEDTEQRPILNRLRRAHGQLGAVITAIEAGANCRDTRP